MRRALTLLGAARLLAGCGGGSEDTAGGERPTAADGICTQQFGGPQPATVTGTVDGDQVDATFSRTDGCEISRWDALDAVLQPAD